jgi:hypothetical protein
MASFLKRDDLSAGGLGLGEHGKQPRESKAGDITSKNAQSATADSSELGRTRRVRAAAQRIRQ